MAGKYTLFILLLIFQITSLQLSAQYAVLRGKVTDDNTGKILTSAKVMVENKQGIVIRSTSTDQSSGEYYLDSIPHGTYTIEYSFKNYKTVRLTQIDLRAQHIVVKNIELKPKFHRFMKKGTDDNKEDKDNLQSLKEEKELPYLLYSGMTMLFVAILVLD